MRILTLAGILAFLLLGCSRPPVFETYTDPGGDFTLEVPQGWPRGGNADRKPKPVSVVEFIGKADPQDEGIPLGAVLSVSKLYRERADIPGDEQTFQRYRTNVLEPTDALFKAPADLTISGRPAREYRRESDHVKAPFHGGTRIPMRFEGFVVETPSAYYVIEYRASRENFDQYSFALSRARTSFRLLAR